MARPYMAWPYMARPYMAREYMAQPHMARQHMARQHMARCSGRWCTMTPLAVPAPGRLRDREIVFANGSQGVNVEILSANPRNYYHVISAGAAMPRVLIDGK